MSETVPAKPSDRRGFKVGIVCALTIEADMVEMVLDKDWSDDIDYGKAAGDPNEYTTGYMAGHNVVLTYSSGSGSNSAAHAALGLRSSFTGIKIVFVVGVCGVTPINAETGQSILLGDCIISTSVVQYDLGRHGPNGFQRKTGSDNLGRADVETRSRITKLKTRKNTLKLEADIASHLEQLQQADPDRSQYPGSQLDRLFDAKYVHAHHLQPDTCEKCNVELGICSKDCEQLGCDEKFLVQRSVTRNGVLPRIHFGCFGSANTVLKSGLDRDKLADVDGFIAFEMEASGVWDLYPTMLIKAASDYADSHKSKKWQPYSAAVAAATLKAFLQQLRLPDEEIPLPIRPPAQTPSQKASILKNTALVYSKYNKHAQAEPLWLQLYDINEKTLGPRHTDTLDCLYALGRGYLSQCKSYPAKAKLAVEAFEKCYSLRKEVLGSEHLHVSVMPLYMAQAYKASNQPTDAEQILSSTIEELITNRFELPIGHVSAMLALHGELCKMLKQNDETRLTYQRLASIPLLDGRFPGSREILIRAGVDTPILQQYMELYCVAQMNPTTGQFDHKKAQSVRCNGCRQLTDMHRGYHHCLKCWEVDFCRNCFRLLQADQPTSPACDKNHSFIQIARLFWVHEPKTMSVFDRQGMAMGSWLEKFRREFLEKIRLNDVAWMQWVEHIRGSISKVSTN